VVRQVCRSTRAPHSAPWHIPDSGTPRSGLRTQSNRRGITVCQTNKTRNSQLECLPCRKIDFVGILACSRQNEKQAQTSASRRDRCADSLHIPGLNGRPVASTTQSIQVENRASPSRISLTSLGASPFFQRAALCLVR
jgi:hypothetical protein